VVQQWAHCAVGKVTSTGKAQGSVTGFKSMLKEKELWDSGVTLLHGVPRRQPHRRSGLATLPSVGAIP